MSTKNEKNKYKKKGHKNGCSKQVIKMSTKNRSSK